MIEIDGVKVLDMGEYTLSTDGTVAQSDAQNYVEVAQAYWTRSHVGEDGTVYATSIRLKLVASRGDFRLTACIPSICTTGLGAADLGGRNAYFSANQRKDTPAHEFGHMLGLNHQSASTQSIMSRSNERAVQLQDVSRIVNAYGRRRR
ncbi:hypothetical protein HC761_00380 [bacterium]|nr:hypothetical protein [bacterium]